MGRATQGVKLINLKGDDSIAAVAQIHMNEDDMDKDENLEDGDIENPNIEDAEIVEDVNTEETDSTDDKE